MTSSKLVTESGGRQNIYSVEPKPYIDENISYESYAKKCRED